LQTTDGQTDRQATDGRATANSEREREFTFAIIDVTDRMFCLAEENRPNGRR